MIIQILMTMKKKIFKYGLFIIVLILSSTTAFSYDINKEYHKSFNVEENSVLGLNNQYGDIIISTNDGNSVSIDVYVTISSKRQETAEQLMPCINVDFITEGNNIFVKTSIDQNRRWVSFKDKEFNIKYVVSMPSWIALNVINRYGNTEIDKLDGTFSADVKYGDINISELTQGIDGNVPQITVSYGSVNIEKANWIDMNLKYSPRTTIDKVQAVAVSSKYSKIYIDEVNSLVIDSKYDKFELGIVKNLVVNAKYADFEIDELSNKLKLACEYGSFDIDDVKSVFSEIIVDAKYTDVSMDIASNAHYKLDANMKYCKLKIDQSKFSNLNNVVNSSSTMVSGVYNAELSTQIGVVSINSSYGDVDLD